MLRGRRIADRVDPLTPNFRRRSIIWMLIRVRSMGGGRLKENRDAPLARAITITITITMVRRTNKDVKEFMLLLKRSECSMSSDPQLAFFNDNSAR